MRRLIAALVLSFGLSLSLPARAEDPLVVAAWSFHMTDYQQTRMIAVSCNNGGGFYEKNPILGQCPQGSDVALYFAATGLGLHLLSTSGPVWSRRAVALAWLAVEAVVVSKNTAIGLSVAW